MAIKCTHLDSIQAGVQPAAGGCEECLKTGSRWLHLRMCLSCGHAGCCDDSPGKHATKHFHKTNHPVMRSIEPNDTWGWCFVDKVMLEFDER